MKKFYEALFAIGVMLVLFGIAGIESPCAIPWVMMAAGILIGFVGHKGEQQYV